MKYKTYKVIVHKNGEEKWYFNNQLHRENGPAIIYEGGTKCWCRNDLLHREDGPAVETSDGKKHYYLDDEKLSKEEWEAKLKAHQGKIVEIEGKKYRLEEVE